MGLFDFVKRAARSVFRRVKDAGRNIFNQVKKGLRTGIKTAINPVDAVNEGIKKMLSKLYSDPQLGGIARRGIEFAKSHPILGDVIKGLEGSSAGIDALEAFSKNEDKEAKQKLTRAAKSLAGSTGSKILSIVEKI